MAPHRSRLSTRLLALPLALVLSVTPAGAAVAAAPTPTSGEVSPAAAPDEGSITLVTGDRVWLQQDASGLLAATVDPAPRSGPAPRFTTVEQDGQLYLYPSDVSGLVPQVLDRELFNLHKLAELADHRAATGAAADGTPVIIAYEDRPAPLAGTAGVSVTAPLPSINGVAATIGADGGWWRSVPPSGAVATRTAGGPLAGVGKVWLDGLAEVALDASGVLVGAPQAWAAGFDGTGVRIAVLDTGVDADHPDLAGKVVAAENFTTEPDAGDDHGHGTHVAGIAAGTGAASGGTYTGVAPGAAVLSGKVCDRSGSCQDSWILAGMQWAAANADVVNMSLGSQSGSDGTDPLSQALNTLSAAHDTLFVTAAGNAGGQGDGSVGAPGAADAALAVGSVDKQERLAGSSSRGPRLGDFAIKPEITAPGVSIVSARADGTLLGPPVGDHYTTVSGTSMASPHVAGAAAILAQQDPQLDAATLKAALASTAVPHPELEVYQQGGGRLEIPAALGAPVRTDRATVDLGHFEWPHDSTEPVAADVRYTNRTGAPVTLDLSLAVTSRDGAEPPAGMLSVSPESVTIPAGGTGLATVTVDVTEGPTGLYGGYLMATADGDVLTRTPVGFHKGPQLHTPTVEGLTRLGEPASQGSSLYFAELTGTDVSGDTLFPGDGPITLQVPAGTYHLMADIPTFSKGNPGPPDQVLVGDPEVEVTDDTTVVLDGRAAVPVQIETPAHPEAVPSDHARIGFERIGADSRKQAVRWIIEEWIPMYAAPTDPVTVGEFGFHSRTQLAEPSDSSYLYDLVFAEDGRIPEDLTYVADPAELVAIDNSFHSDLAGHQRAVQRHIFRPVDNASVLFSPPPLDAPLRRTEYLVGSDTRYRQNAYAQWPLTGRMSEPVQQYQPGEQRDEAWFRAPLVPGVPADSPFESERPSYRTGDLLSVRMQEWSDSDGHYGPRRSGLDTAALRVYQDGELIGQAAGGFGDFPVSPDPAVHRLELDLARDAPWWQTSTRTRSTWTVQSPGTGSGPVPLLLASYRAAALDLTNTAAPETRQQVNVQVRHQPGATGPAVVPRAQAWVSYDDGQTWRRQPVAPLGDGEFTIRVLPPHPRANAEFASLRIAAADQDGNAIEQEVIRAWRLP